MDRTASENLEVIRDLADSLSKAKNNKEILSVLAEFTRQVPGLEKHTVGSYSLGEFLISLDYLDDQKELYEGLIKVYGMDLQIAPEIINQISVGTTGLLITRFKSGEFSKHETPYLGNYRHSVEALFNPDAVAVVAADVEKLIEHGLIHEWAAESFDCWVVNTETGQISITGWHTLRRASTADELAEFRDSINQMLERKATV
ncbi:MAG: hypothetical protein O2931_01685 [Planctomycetota bacterium]|nr:hypothetical protein [Planctomycetota bacterium]MDA1177484.1 hypothetical protein [Planctomycetota bacterium]